MQSKSRRILQGLLMTGLLGVIVVVGYIMIVVAQMPLEILAKDQLTTFDGVKGETSSLEEGALVSKTMLKKYLLLSDERGNDWIQHKIGMEEIEDLGKFYSIKKNIELPGSLKNSCKNLYCYQHKVEFDRIPSIFWKGLIGIEDYRFINHFGIDFFAIARAIWTDLRKMRFEQGGSTLTQQLVKNLFLSNEKTITRKLKEIIYSIYIELRFEKEQILEAYFNEVYWGAIEGLRIKGIYAASLYYFNLKPWEISPYQATILISMLKGPGYYSPVRHIERLRKRVNIVYNKLAELHLYPSKDSNIWGDKQWSMWGEQLKKSNTTRLGLSHWKAARIEKKDFELFDRFIFIGAADKVLNEIKRIKKIDEDISVKAVMGIPHRTEVDVFKYYSKVERDWDEGIKNERHQVGSTLKPILYNIFFQEGRSEVDMVSTEPITLKLLSGSWSPRESHKMDVKEVSLLSALQQSLNGAVIRIAEEIGFKVIENKLDAFIPDLKKPLGQYPAQLLGAVELSVMELYEVYLKFITEECENGRADILLKLLADPTTTTVRRVVSKEMRGMRFFGKTGTSNRGLDNWYVFYDGDILGVIWVGLDGIRKEKNLRLYGSSTAFQIFQNFAINRGKRFSELSCEAF